MGNKKSIINLVKEGLKYCVFYLVVFIICTALYALSFRTPLFASLNVYFYRATKLLIVVGIVMFVLVVLFAKYNNFIKITVRDIALAMCVALCLNMAFLSLVTVAIDRSISVYILSHMAQNPDTAFTEEEITQNFLDVYMDDYEAMQRRFDEQLITGSIRQDGDKYQITEKGCFLVDSFRLVAKVFPIDNRFLYPPEE
ncbi:MAG: hypothetical protein PHY44_00095 [Lachnospiraceae bacterium]|nr:hypothetical protein [Lachnospiraceae bacterium]